MFERYDKSLKYLMACSGGPDSMALLNMLLKENFKIIVAHVNYKTRDESDGEEQLVKDFCKKNNIEVFTSIYQDDNSKNSFEVKARNFRYNFFNKIYLKNNCSGLFVAHHKDDLIETYLLKKRRNVINNSYLIEEETKIKNMIVYRPMLQYFSKDDLLNYCKKNDIPFGIDKTNEMDIYFRNKIRKELKNLNKEIIYQEAINAENNLIQTRKEVKEFISYYPLYLISNLSNKNDLFLSLFLYELIDKKYKRKVNHALLLKLKEFLKSTKPNLKYEIDSNYFLLKEYQTIKFSFNTNENFSYQLNELKYFSCPFFTLKKDGLKMQGIFLKDEDFPIIIRNYKADDYILLKEGKKKVSRLFIDKKVPKEERNKVPVIENKNGEIIFVYNLYRKYGYKNLKNNLFMEK